MRASYSPGYTVPLPSTHPFPMGKFESLHRRLLEDGVIADSDIEEPSEAPWDELELVHTPRFLATLRDGLDPRAERKLGLPWSPALVRRSRLAVAGTRDAARFALEDGVAANLAGGTHHAFPDHGEGFCVLNDVAVAIRVLFEEGSIRRALIVDLDVHQGNGNAAIFADDPRVFTFSAHGMNNYPFQKPPSTLDFGLADGTTDEQYLTRLGEVVPRVFAAARPEIVFFLAGVDVVAGDRFGRLALTPAGLEARERLVLGIAWRLGIPLTLVLSGGYAESSERTAELHALAHRAAHEIFEAEVRAIPRPIRSG